MTTLFGKRPSDIDGELRRFSGDEYLTMGRVGILPGQGDEMLDGIVVVRGSEKPWYWSRFDFDKMIEVGILRPDERVELIDGEVIALAPIGPEHMEAMTRLNRILIRLEDAFGPEYCVIPESPIHIGDFRPQADILVAKGDLGELGARGLSPSDIALVVEVSNSTLRTDRKRKYRHYAEVGIPEYWIINLQTRCLEAYREPSGGGYGTTLKFETGERVSPLFAPTITIAISDILPRRQTT